MSRARHTTWTLLVAAGFALAAPPASAQDPPVPKKNDAAFQAVRDYYGRAGIPQNELKGARENFGKFARFFADVVAHPALWQSAQSGKDLPQGFPFPSLDGPTGMFRELDRFLLEAVPGGTKVGRDQVDYIRELGAALDAAMRNLIETSPEPVVRINAARTLAHVARTGAPAHFETLAALIAAPNTRTEIKYHLFQAAAAALSAYDADDLKQRKHAAEPKLVGALVKALQDCVSNPALLLPGYKPEEATADQVAVLALVRRQAVKALAQTKFATLPGPDGKTPIYPAHTLVRVALGDPNLAPAPGPAEAAEAVIGICNMQPPAKGYNAEIAAEAVAQGLRTFSGPRAADITNRTLAWRNYALRLAEAMMRWRQLSDPAYDFALPNKPVDPQGVPAVVEALYKEALPNVLYPIEKADPAVGVRIQVLDERLKLIRANPKRNTTLFAGAPQTTIEFVAPTKPKDPKEPKDPKDPKDGKDPKSPG